MDDVELAVHALRREKLANDITVARDGEAALDMSSSAPTPSQFQSPPRVVLLDLKLPKVQGLEVLQAIKGDPRTKAIPVVMASTSSRKERDLVDSYKMGVNAYVQKPVDFEQFRTMVRELGLFWVVMNQAPPAQAFGRTGPSSSVRLAGDNRRFRVAGDGRRTQTRAALAEFLSLEQLANIEVTSVSRRRGAARPTRRVDLRHHARRHPPLRRDAACRKRCGSRPTSRSRGPTPSTRSAPAASTTPSPTSCWC